MVKALIRVVNVIVVLIDTLKSWLGFRDSGGSGIGWILVLVLVVVVMVWYWW